MPLGSSIARSVVTASVATVKAAAGADRRSGPFVAAELWVW